MNDSHTNPPPGAAEVRSDADLGGVRPGRDDAPEDDTAPDTEQPARRTVRRRSLAERIAAKEAKKAREEQELEQLRRAAAQEARRHGSRARYLIGDAIMTIVEGADRKAAARYLSSVHNLMAGMRPADATFLARFLAERNEAADDKAGAGRS
jgi:hypothetical protein